MLAFPNRILKRWSMEKGHERVCVHKIMVYEACHEFRRRKDVVDIDFILKCLFPLWSCQQITFDADQNTDRWLLPEFVAHCVDEMLTPWGLLHVSPHAKDLVNQEYTTGLAEEREFALESQPVHMF